MSTDEDGSTFVSISETIREVEVWENQRYVLFKGWGPYRLPTDRPLWSNRKGDRRRHLESVLLPASSVWACEWFIDLPGGPPSTSRPDGLPAARVSDPNSDFGWLYAPDFTVPTKYCSTKSSPIMIVRRRRWVRRLQVVDVSQHPEAVAQPTFWAQNLFYGFSAADVDGSEQERQRHHESFHRLSRFCKKTSLQSLQIGLVSSVPSVVDGEEGSATASASPTALSTQKVLTYVYKYGVASCIRADIWKLWATIRGFDLEENTNAFSSLSSIAGQSRDGTDAVEIGQDVVRTAPKHPLFDGKGSIGQLRLRNVLMTISICPDMTAGYHQAFSYIAAMLLLHTQPEDAYCLMLHALRNLLPPGYHEHYLLRYDIQIVLELLQSQFPHIDAAFQANQIDISVFASGWLQGLFCAHFPFSSAARFFELMLAEGNSTMLVRVLVAFVRLHEKALLSIDSSCSLGQFANQWARERYDVQPLLDIVQEDKLTQHVLQHRERLRSTQGTPGE
jgi:hypothetical protein